MLRYLPATRAQLQSFCLLFLLITSVSTASWACLDAKQRGQVAQHGLGSVIVGAAPAEAAAANASSADSTFRGQFNAQASWAQIQSPVKQARQQLAQRLALLDESPQWTPAKGHGVLLAPNQDTGDQDTSNQETGTLMDVHPGHSGAWSSPERDGEGIQVEILSAERALVFWFTYDEVNGANNGNGQFWMGGTGRIENQQIIIDDVVSTSGPVFGSEFDPNAVQRTPWGRFVVSFNDCGSGQVEYEGREGFDSGTIAIQRLTGNPRVPCGAASSEFLPPSADVPGVSGNWFDPTHDGEGWFIQEIAPGVAGFSWLTYNQHGEQAWILGVGFWSGRSLIVPAMQITGGTAFGDDFNAADVQREPWGVVQFVFDTCDRATLVYNSPIDGFGSGVLRPVRLTQSDFLPCAFSELKNLSAGSWQLQGGAPELSELPATVLNDDIYIGGGFRGGFQSRREFWRYTPATSAWQQLADLPQQRDHGMMTTFNGEVYFLGGSLDQSQLGSTWRYIAEEDRWEFRRAMPHPRFAGGAVVHENYIYVLGGMQQFIDRYDPENNEWVSFELPETAGRDHSAAVIYRDEIWLLGGRRAGRAHGVVAVFNPLTGVARSAPRIQHPRSGFAAAVMNDQIVVAGGENFMPLETTNTVEYYSPETDSWQFAPSLPSAVHGVSGVSFDGRFFVMPGSISPGGINNLGQIQIYTPQP
ncbi:MAG: hypothetical protein MI750_16855 [Xanthomonadales bacterium]|nr:hypothetical protein [Xanthomonadales bacterium]